jgi:glycosyltransferase involved in cell wall biosynthesis
LKNFAGELGSITDRVLFVGRHSDRTGMSEISRMFSRMFGSYIPMQWVQVWNPTAASEVKKALDKNQIVVFAEMPWHNSALQEVIINSKSGTLVGILLWDSDHIPEHFVRVLSKFHKIIVPTEFISKVLSTHLPEMEIKVLPLALDTRRFSLSSLASQLKQRSEYPRIGIIASQHPRKNLDLVLSAAARLWEEGQKFELVILGFLSQGANLSASLARIPSEIKEEFLQIYNDEKNEADFLEVLNSFDLLLSASSGEGFNIPARQALSSGIPVLITDIPGHQELKNLPGVYMIRTSGLVPAVYPEFGSKVYGSQSLIEVSEIVAALGEYLNLENKVDPLEIAASSESWDFRNLEARYREEIFGTPKHGQVKKNKPLIIVGHDAGFFAIFNTFISIQNTWTGQHGYQEVYPDWRVKTMQKFWRTDEFTSFCYGQPDDGNLYFKLFDVENQFLKPEDEIQQILDSGIRAHSFNASADPNLTFVNADKLYRSHGLNSWRKSMNTRMGGLRPNEKVRKRLQSTFENIDDDTFLIGMHVRHPSHAMEQPGSQIALAGDYISLAFELIDQEHLRNPGRRVKVFLATDQEVVRNQFMEAFGEALITVEGVARVTAADSSNYDSAHSSMKLSEGFQIQHLNAKNSQKWNMSLAEDVIADAWGLARCHVMVHTVSNVATAVMFINPEIKCIPIYKGMSLKQIENLIELRRLTSII